MVNDKTNMLVMYSFQSLLLIDMKFSLLMFISWKEYEVPQFSKESSSASSQLSYIYKQKLFSTFPQELIAQV